MKENSIRGKYQNIVEKEIKVWKNKVYKCYKGSWLHTASVKSTVGNKLGFFLAPSTFQLAHDSIRPERSEATT